MLPSHRVLGCFSDFWKEAEKLVDEGLVRSLGLNKYTAAAAPLPAPAHRAAGLALVSPSPLPPTHSSTIHQIEATLQFARHRPVVHTFEQHILNQAPEMVAFCKANGIAPRAHVCLAKGDVFESACLQRDDMSAPQVTGGQPHHHLRRLLPLHHHLTSSTSSLRRRPSSGTSSRASRRASASTPSPT